MVISAKNSSREIEVKEFKPDLIIEVTGVCNRSCQGCYAPNVVSKEAASELVKKTPEKFLSMENLQQTLLNLEEAPSLISIRGGEPTLHPDLPSMLSTIRYFGKVIALETHGRWLLKNEREQYSTLISSLQSSGTVVKVSFDSMHGTRTSELMEILSALKQKGIAYLVAVTEYTFEDFEVVKSSIPWVSEDKIIFQKKAKQASELVSPSIGVINVKGELNSGLTSKYIKPIDLKTLNIETIAG